MESKIKQNTYLVGGAVRDKILEIDNNDLDYVVIGITPEEMIQADYTPIPANEFPIFIKDGNEYALARKEVKTGKGYKGFQIFTDINVTLEEDLFRRDLTINSIAIDSSGNYFDPYNGLSDIQKGILRHTSEAFKEDPVRVLRVCRFMAQFGDFIIANETLTLMKEMVSTGELNDLTPERIWKETEKALKSKAPWLFFESLKECGALQIIFPELYALIDVPQPLEHHPENCCFFHTMLALKQSKLRTKDSVIHFAVICHDLGKAISPKETLPHHYGHEKVGVSIVDTLCDRLKVPNEYRNLALKVTEQHQLCHKALDIKPSKVVSLLNNIGAFRQYGEVYVRQFITACISDATGRLGFESRQYPQADYLVAVWLAINKMDNSKIVMKYKGKRIAEQINQDRIRVAIEVKREWDRNK